MKKTVTRWATKNDMKLLRSGECATIVAWKDKDSTSPNEIEVTYDDGTPEPECECAKVTDQRGTCCPAAPSHCICCQSTAPGPRTEPCECGRKAAPATRDRVVEGFVGEGIDPRAVQLLGFSSKAAYINRPVPATLIIHEPVREQTLYEAALAYIKECKEPVDPNYAPYKDLYDATLREKAAREGERK